MLHLSAIFARRDSGHFGKGSNKIGIIAKPRLEAGLRNTHPPGQVISGQFNTTVQYVRADR